MLRSRPLVPAAFLPFRDQACVLHTTALASRYRQLVRHQRVSPDYRERQRYHQASALKVIIEVSLTSDNHCAHFSVNVIFAALRRESNEIACKTAHSGRGVDDRYLEPMWYFPAILPCLHDAMGYSASLQEAEC